MNRWGKVALRALLIVVGVLALVIAALLVTGKMKIDIAIDLPTFGGRR